MGSVVSVHKDQETSRIMKYQLPENSSEANDKNLLISSSALDFKSRNFGSKEENFFDSQAWLESDCDDDFRSVNGEFTPSRNSASDPQSNSIGTKELSAESSPTDRKKRLSELLKENLGGDVDVSRLDKQNTSDGKVESAQANLEHIATPRTPRRSPYMFGLNSLCSSEKSPRHPKPEREKSAASSVQCCLPSYLMTSRSFNERKKRLSPERNGLAA
ncbi:uncharacterized protein At3g27210-like [Papaver somniferum]|uniref:uncharacterized protein At3g27210-like n=1 Tax=Papaver somniferum TaxID=3469 RepID=UPI000E6F7642|nr:uncharacterized protein At3g27210-like [Papaver somniferum]